MRTSRVHEEIRAGTAHSLSPRLPRRPTDLLRLGELGRQRPRRAGPRAGDRAGQADVEPAQAGELVRLGRDDRRPAPAAPRGRTPGPWPAGRHHVELLELARRRGRRRARRARSRLPRARSPRGRPARRRRSGRPSPIVARCRARRDDQPVEQVVGRHALDVEPPRVRPGRTTGAPRPGAMAGSSRAAYSITSPGTRKPLVSCSMCASALPRWRSAVPQEPVAHGVVAWARSPSTVAEPVEQRRPTARSIIGERSCASSATTWPRLGVRSHEVGGLVDQHRVGQRPPRAAGLLGGRAHSSSACSSAVEQPVGGRGEERRRRRAAAAPAAPGRPPATPSTYLLTSRLRATASCTRSSGESPASSIFTRIAWASRCASIAAGGAVPDAAGAQLARRSPPPRTAGTRHARAARHDERLGRALHVRPDAPGAGPRPAGRRP